MKWQSIIDERHELNPMVIIHDYWQELEQVLILIKMSSD